MTICFIAFIFLCLNSAFAQTYDSFKQKQQEEFREFKKQRAENFKKFVEQREAYIEKLDQQFTQFLNNYWKEYEAFRAKPTPDKPGPEETPEYDKKAMEKITKQPLEKVDPSKPKPKDAQLPVLEKSVDKASSSNKQSISFYGANLDYPVPENMKPSLPNKLNSKAIANAWKHLIKTDYYPLLEQTLELKQKLNLNDWGYCLLLEKVSQKICSGEGNDATALQWFLLTKAQYDSRLGFKEQSLYLLLPFQHEIYNARYFKVGDRQYYSFKENAQNLTIYKKNYKEAIKVVNLNISQSPNFPEHIASRIIQFEGEKLEFNYNKNAIRFYDTYPQASLQVYFDAAMAGVTKESVHENLQPLIKDQPERQAVNTLLGFVHQFKYQTDQEQFGKEKFFFPAEAFHYPYADCEDRSALFAYLVRELLGLEVVGLEYPQHIATAVNLSQSNQDYSFKYKDDQFFICDPTYEGAPMGAVVPQVKNEKARVLVLNNKQSSKKRAQQLWKMVNKAGGNRSVNQNNIAYDEHNNAYVTGYFNGKLQLGNHAYTSHDGKRDAFVACFDENNNPVWVLPLKGPGQDIGHYVLNPAQGQGLYLTGIYNKELKGGEQTLSASENTGLYVAHVSENGAIQWINNTGLEEINAANNANFTACFSTSGTHQWNRFYNNNENFEDFGLQLSKEGKLYVNGNLNKSTGLRTKRLASGGQFDAVTALKTKTDELENKLYHQTVAGLFAVIELIKNSGMELEGAEVQKALNKYNPDFKSRNPTIYKNIGNIRFIKNANGIVKIKTHDGQSVSFSNMDISDGSRIKITHHASGNASIEVLSGIEVGKAIVWYDLNSIKLHRKNPDLVFDYSDDHTKKTVSMTDILN